MAKIFDLQKKANKRRLERAGVLKSYEKMKKFLKLQGIDVEKDLSDLKDTIEEYKKGESGTCDNK